MFRWSEARNTQSCRPCALCAGPTKPSFFQNEEIFVHLDELDESPMHEPD